MEEEIKPVGVRKKQAKVVYEQASGTITVVFPQFVSQLQAVSDKHGIKDVTELISHLQGYCLTLGLRPDWRKFSTEEEREMRLYKERSERCSRMVQAREQKKAEERHYGSFIDRVKKTRDKLGDF